LTSSDIIKYAFILYFTVVPAHKPTCRVHRAGSTSNSDVTNQYENTKCIRSHSIDESVRPEIPIGVSLAPRISMTPPTSIGGRRKFHDGGLALSGDSSTRLTPNDSAPSLLAPPSREADWSDAFGGRSPDLSMFHYRNANMSVGRTPAECIAQLPPGGRPDFMLTRLALLNQQRDGGGRSNHQGNDDVINLNGERIQAADSRSNQSMFAPPRTSSQPQLLSPAGVHVQSSVARPSFHQSPSAGGPTGLGAGRHCVVSGASPILLPVTQLPSIYESAESNSVHLFDRRMNDDSLSSGRVVLGYQGDTMSSLSRFDMDDIEVDGMNCVNDLQLDGMN